MTLAFFPPLLWLTLIFFFFPQKKKVNHTAATVSIENQIQHYTFVWRVGELSAARCFT